MEEKPLFGNLTVYRERGAFLRRLEQFHRATASYDEALRLNTDDVRTLTGRSQACSDAVEPMQAYTDAEIALQLEPRNMIAKNMQCRALYTMLDFERSLVTNYRGAQLRKKPPYFTEGINQGLQTLEDCVGTNAGSVMLDLLPLIKQSEDTRASEEELTKPLRVSRIPRPEEKKKFTQMEARKHLTLSRVLAMKYLGSMAYDKFFLQELCEDERLISANIRGSKNLQALVTETLKTLTQRQEMLRAQRPYYSVKLAEKAISSYQTNYNKKILETEREINTKSAERMLKLIEKCLHDHRIMDVIARAERMQIFLDMKTKRTLPDKDIYIDRLYRFVGDGYLAQYRLSYTLSDRSNRRRVAFLLGLPVGRPTSFDSVIANYPFKFLETKHATEFVKQTLDMCENSTQRCWLMYELAKLLCAQKNYALAKFYAKRCQREAKDLCSATWWLNANFVLISGDMQQGNINEVKVEVEEGLNWTKRMQDPERVQAFLAKCAEIASETLTAYERKAVILREKQILSVMDDQVKVEQGVLFKRMEILPAGRRFAVLPSKLGKFSEESERKKRKQRGLTVVPGTEKTLPPPPRSKTLGFQIFDV